MDNRTMEIIAVCKGGTKYDSDASLTDVVKNYMSDIFACDKDYYTDNEMTKIMTEAMYDYIDTCDVPSSFLRKLSELKWITDDLVERICIAFRAVQICSGRVYINGFSDDYVGVVEGLR